MHKFVSPEASIWSGFKGVVKRDLRLAMRRQGDWINPLLFLLLVVSLFPMGVGPEPVLLSKMSAGVIWVAALLSTLLSLDALFRSDVDDGSLEQMLVSPQPLALLVLAKVFVHWLVSGLPLVIASPLLATMLNMKVEAMPAMVISLLLGTPLLSLIGAIGVGLTVSIRRGGMLLALLVLPLYVPALVFGTGAIEAAVAGMSVESPLMILGAMLIMALVLAPVTTAWALRISQD